MVVDCLLKTALLSALIKLHLCIFNISQLGEDVVRSIKVTDTCLAHTIWFRSWDHCAISLFTLDLGLCTVYFSHRSHQVAEDTSFLALWFWLVEPGFDFPGLC